MRLRTLCSALSAALLMLSASPVSAGTEYIYDSAGRLIKVIYSNGVVIEYRYDAAGNRTTIVTSQPPNTSPDAVNDAASVNASASVNIQVRNNDTDPDGNSLTVTSVTTPSGGSATIQGGGTYVRYTAPSSTGTKTFSYTISDGAGGTDTATVTVTVSSANTPPVAIDDTGSTAVGTTVAIFVLGNDTDAQNHPLSVASVTQPSAGSVSIASGGGYVNYTAPSSGTGTYTFTYTVSDGNGGTDVGEVSVEVTGGENPGCDPNYEVCGP